MRGHTGPRLRRCATTFSNTVLVFFLVLLSWTPFNNVVEAWPYVDCSATNSIFALQRVTAYYDHGNSSIGLTLQGNFTDTYWAQGYSAQATSQCKQTRTETPSTPNCLPIRYHFLFSLFPLHSVISCHGVGCRHVCACARAKNRHGKEESTVTRQRQKEKGPIARKNEHKQNTRTGVSGG